MSKTYDFLTIEKPEQFPFETIVKIKDSVFGIHLKERQVYGELRFIVYPTFPDYQNNERRLVFSLEESPKLHFNYIQSGKEKIDGQIVYLLLERN